MNDEQMRPLLKAWFRMRAVPPTDVPNGVAQVVARLPQTRQRSRWGLLPVFDRPALIPSTNGRQPARGSTVFSALKFLAASVIVALFGGFLLTGVFTTQQGDEMVPAAVTASPSPMTTEEVLSGMVTEEVEPGIFRVINDGVRDLTLEGLWGWWIDIIAGQDGSAWIVTDHHLFRLGDERTHRWSEEMRSLDDLAPLGVDAEGVAWLGGSTDVGPWRGLFALEGEAWTRYAPLDVPAGVALSEVEFGPDGAVWVALGCCDSGLEDSPSDVALPVLARLEDGVWDITHTQVPDRGSLHVGSDGPFGFVDEIFSRYDGSEWQPQEMPYDGTDSFADLDQRAGPEDTLWLGLWGECPVGQEDACGETHSPRYGLARYDGDGWEEWLVNRFPEKDGENLLSALFLRTVGFDGSLWGSVQWGVDGASWPSWSGDAASCDGVARFDGTVLSRHLRGLCVGPMEVAPDGGLWLLASSTPSTSTDVYVIDPEAVAITEAETTEPSSVTEPTDTMGASTTTEALLPGMVVEEVEPGVFRIDHDGVRDLSHPAYDFPGYRVDVTPDGSVWLSGGGGRPGLLRLGDESTFDDPAELHGSIQVAPDGWLWALGQFPDDRMAIFSFDGQGWTERTDPTGHDPHLDPLLYGLAIGPDGTIWVAATDERKRCPDIEGGECLGTLLMRLEADGSLTTVEDWADVYEGDAHPFPLVVSPDGDVWLRGHGRPGGPDAEALLRFDGSGWEAIPLPEGFADASTFLPFGVAPDGTVWVQLRGLVAGHSGARGLARFDDPGWTIFTEPDDGLGWQGWMSGGDPVWLGEDLLTVAADGSLWHPGRPTEEDPCGGVAHFDGTTWTSHLVEACIGDLAIARDGSVWLLGDDLYVITPEAVAGTD